MPRLIPRAAVIVLLACVTLMGVAYASGKTDSIDKARRLIGYEPVHTIDRLGVHDIAG